MTTTIGASVLDSSLFISDLKPKRKLAALQEMVQRAHDHGVVREPRLLLDTLMLRERLGGSAIGKAVAIPHARSVAVREARLVVACSRRGIDWGAPDDLDVQLVLLVLSPSDSPCSAHCERVIRTASFARLQRNRQRLLDAVDPAAAAAAIGDLVS
jgi:mannitol/fructose-specific phosphotransferase system IIA component (Ntr-type)